LAHSKGGACGVAIAAQMLMLLDDLRHSLRSLRRTASLTTVVVLTAALGIGAGTSLFSVVKAVLLNPLPYPEPDRLAWVPSLFDKNENRTSQPDFDDWRAQNHSFSALAAYGEAPVVVGSGTEPQHTHGAIVTEDFFDVFRAQPERGRL